MSKWSSSSLRPASGAADISTLLSKDTEIRGAVKAQGSIRIDGTVIGDVLSMKTVTIGVSGIVEGNVSGEDLIIAGKIKGTVTARGRIALEASAQIEGDLNTSRLAIAEGAVFRGLSNMGVAVRSAVRTPETKAPAAREGVDRVAAA
jgi:cytoskeletal protein CcmA (bactofilin family)